MKTALRFAIDMEEAVIVSAPDGPRSSTVAFPVIDYALMLDTPFSVTDPIPWKIVMFPFDAHFRTGRLRWLTPTETTTIPPRLRAVHEGAWRGEPALFTDDDLKDVRTASEGEFT